MQIFHHVVWRPTVAHLAALLALGFDPSAPDGLLALDIDEADGRWPEVKALAGDGALDHVSTRASDRECLEAAWLLMRATGQHGYPQPENDYQEVTYGATDHCPKCNLGLTQRAPFRFRSDPKLRPNRVLQLNWVYDEFFTTPETWERVFRPLGIAALPAVRHSTGMPLATLVQLEIGEAPALCSLAGQAFETCAACARARFRAVNRGFLPPFAAPAPRGHLVRTREQFGSGGLSFREVLISAALYRAMREAKVRGAFFLPTSQPSA